MAYVVMYSTTIYPYCVAAEQLLRQHGVEQVEKILVDRKPGKREEMMTCTNHRAAPQVYIDERHIDDFDDLSTLGREDGLVPLPAAWLGELHITQKCSAWTGHCIFRSALIAGTI